MPGSLVGAGIAAGRWFGRTRNRGWARVSVASAIIVAGAAVAAGIAYRLIQRGIVATGPAGLLELVSFLVGFAWTTAFAVRLIRRPGPAAVSGRAAAEPS
ncbi:hypothetical protein [Microlunatus sp. GCM10028923]|uniref:hypothetical protein n=1 Tax=Microlunatus sp. GCM10028923 TaxID=3273400 RepID=UPI00360741D2